MKLIHFVDIDFSVLIEPEEYHTNYTVYDIIGYDGRKTFYHKSGAWSKPDMVGTTEESEPFLHGHVKWDGCSNWHFDEQDSLMIHGCSLEDITRIGIVLGRCWKMTRKFCDHWNY